MTQDDHDWSGSTRRRFLAAAGTASMAGLAGCSNPLGNDGGQSQQGLGLADFRGSGPLVESRGTPGGTSMDDLPDLSGELNIYIGGGEGGLYETLLGLLEQKYDDFSTNLKSDASASLANTIVEEQAAGGSRADVFWSVDAGSLALVAAEGAAASISEDAYADVDPSFVDDQGRWVGVAGRARAVPYNTDVLSASDVPDKVRQFPNTAAFENSFGWAPSYGAFQAFVTAMRLNRGEDATRQFLQNMMDHGAQKYPNEFFISNRVADGEINAGFANHYYALRVKTQRPDAPLDLAFTSGDAGGLVNVSGAQLIEGTQRTELATNFVRHLVSAEAQEYFATRAFAYPTVPEVPPAGGLPSVDELEPPNISLQDLSDVQPTIELMRDVGLL